MQGIAKTARKPSKVRRLRRPQHSYASDQHGSVGIVVAPPGQRLLVSQLTITGGKIARINVIADPTRLSQLHLSLLSNPGPLRFSPLSMTQPLG